MSKSEEQLWQEISSLETIQERRMKVLEDVNSKKHRYKKLAESEPHVFFELLGGEDQGNRSFWAHEFTYEEHLKDNGEEYDEEAAKCWDLEAESIRRAEETGFYYVTGLVHLDVTDDEYLTFEVDYCEGYFANIIATPYDEEVGNLTHGFPF